MVEFSDIEKASKRLAAVAVRTPLLRSSVLDEVAGCEVWIKPETLQRTGSFKFRGAYNMISQLDEQQRRRGIVAFSSGNHAQAVAMAGAMLNIRTTIVMPRDAPAIKIDNTRRQGGKIVFYDRYSEDREAIAANIASESNGVIIPAFDHEHIIAGQGTVGLELMQQCRESGAKPQQVLVSCSGGGLIAGTVLAVKTLSPSAKVHPVEPEGFDDTARSLISGRRETNDRNARSICDALQSERPGELTFAINGRLLGPGIVVNDAEVKDAIRFAFRHLKLVVEPSGAAPLAAILKRKHLLPRRATAIVLSGANVDSKLFVSILNEKDRTGCS